MVNVIFVHPLFSTPYIEENMQRPGSRGLETRSIRSGCAKVFGVLVPEIISGDAMFKNLIILPAQRLQGPTNPVMPSTSGMDAELAERAAKQLGFQPKVTEASPPRERPALAETLRSLGCGTFAKDSVKKYMSRVEKKAIC